MTRLKPDANVFEIANLYKDLDDLKGTPLDLNAELPNETSGSERVAMFVAHIRSMARHILSSEFGRFQQRLAFKVVTYKSADVVLFESTGTIATGATPGWIVGLHIGDSPTTIMQETGFDNAMAAEARADVIRRQLGLMRRYQATYKYHDHNGVESKAQDGPIIEATSFVDAANKILTAEFKARLATCTSFQIKELGQEPTTLPRAPCEICQSIVGCDCDK